MKESRRSNRLKRGKDADAPVEGHSVDLNKRRKTTEAEPAKEEKPAAEGEAKPATPWAEAGKKMCSLRDKELGICESC